MYRRNAYHMFDSSISHMSAYPPERERRCAFFSPIVFEFHF
jgi:hypothetical protein